MKTYERTKKRPQTKVIEDVNDTTKIIREDVYDVIKGSKTKAEAKARLKSFINKLGKDVHQSYQGKERIYNNIVSDLDSYGIEWE